MTSKTSNPLGLVNDGFTVTHVTGESAKVVAHDDLYDRYRPDTFTADTERDVDNYRADFIASVIAVGGNMAIEALTKDSGLTSVDVTGRMGSRGNSMGATVSRERKSRNPRTGEEIHSYGSTHLNVKTVYSSKRGNIEEACRALSKRATEQFS